MHLTAVTVTLIPSIIQYVRAYCLCSYSRTKLLREYERIQLKSTFVISAPNFFVELFWDSFIMDTDDFSAKVAAIISALFAAESVAVLISLIRESADDSCWRLKDIFLLKSFSGGTGAGRVIWKFKCEIWAARRHKSTVQEPYYPSLQATITLFRLIQFYIWYIILW